MTLKLRNKQFFLELCYRQPLQSLPHKNSKFDPLKFAIDLAKTPENANSLLREIDEINQKNCFMSYDNIKRQLDIIGITVDSPKKNIIDEIYQRRNQIAHQSDRLPKNPIIKQDIAESTGLRYIQEIEEVISDIDSKILSK